MSNDNNSISGLPIGARGGDGNSNSGLPIGGRGGGGNSNRSKPIGSRGRSVPFFVYFYLLLKFCACLISVKFA